MAILDTLISESIRSTTYYPEYVAKVAKYQRYFIGEVVSDDEAPATKPAKGATPKTTRKPKPQSPKTAPVAKPAASKISKSTSSQPTKSKPTPAKPQEKKRKLSTLQLVDEFVYEGVPADEPRFGDEEADMHKAVEESLKDAYVAPRGPLPPVVIREPEPGKYEPLPEVQGKGKEKVGEEQAAQVLLNLQTPKKKNSAEQFIFQRCTPAPTVPLIHEESFSLYVELGLTDSETKSNNEASREGQAGSDPGKQVEDQAGSDPGKQVEGQAGSDPGKQVEDQAGSDPGKQVEGQAGSDPGVAADSQIQPSHVVHAGPNLEHMNLEVSDTSPQPNPEQMDEEFTTMAYPNVQENLKLPTEGEVRLEEPASSAGTLSSMQNLDKELSFTNQFLVEKSQEDEPEKTNTEVEVQSMVTVPIHQDTASVPLMTSSIIDLTVSQPASTMVQASIPTSTATENQTLEERLDKQGNRMHQLETQDLSGMIKEQIMEYMRTQEIDQKIHEMVKEAVTASVQYAMRAPLCARFKDLLTFDMKEILLQRMLEENYDKGYEDHKMAYEALQKSILRDESEQFDADKAEKLKKKKRKQDLPKTPPGSHPPPLPPPPPSGDQSQGSDAPGSSKTAASAAYTAWTTTTSRFEPSASSIPKDVFMHEELDVEAQDLVSDDEDIGSRHIPKVNLNQEWFKPLSEEERPATLEPALSIPSSSLPVPINNWASVIASGYVPPLENSLLSQTGDIGGFIDWFCKKQGITKLTTKHLEGPAYEVFNAFHPDGDRLALSITKIKAAHYPDAGLEQMVPDQMWIEEECMYDISATYGISHWWFKRQKFYIDRHSPDTNRRAIVRTHMRILSVVRIEVFLIYEYDYTKKIILRRADNQEYTIAENNFKDLYPSDFEDLYLLNLQGHLNHLPPRDRKILSSVVNLWIRNLVIRQRMLMRFNEIHKFSDGTLQQIDEALDYRVKELKVNKNNPALNTRFWTMNDVIKCKQFMFAIQKRLKLRRIF
ncbi:hypothetical protein Tco_0267930 [Tanacetum coccineum]